MKDVVFDVRDYLSTSIGDGFICSGGFGYSWLNIASGVWVPSMNVHIMLDLLRTGYLKYRLSREACPDIVIRCSIVEYPPAVLS